MIVQGNSFRLPLADNSVHCIITSIPYWNLRDYGLPPLVFGGRADCRHEWGTEKIIKQAPQRDHNGADFGNTREYEQSRQGMAYETSTGQFCRLCHAWRGQYGLEPTISLFIQHSIEVARECKRALRPDGVMWWNIGDSYSTARNGRSAADGKALGNDDRTFRDKPFTVDEIPAKNLCLIPERIVIALQDDGWIVRSVASWLKRSAMPESVADRPGTAHEYVFMLTKSPRYFWDVESVRRGQSPNSHGGSKPNIGDKYRLLQGDRPLGMTPHQVGESGRALRTSDFFFDSLDAYIAHLQDIRDNGGLMLETDGSPAAFVVNPKGYKYAHYATFPLDLITPMIKASTSERGVCKSCGAPWVRIVEKGEKVATDGRKTWGHEKISGSKLVKSDEVWNRNQPMLRSMAYESQTLGWCPSCDCYRTRNQTKCHRQDALQDYYDFLMDVTKDEQESDGTRAIAFVQASRFWPYLWSSRVAKNHTAPTIPAIVLDPFVGSGTTVLAAQQLGRRGIGADLNPTYLLENALPRTAKKGGRSLEDLPLFALQEATL